MEQITKLGAQGKPEFWITTTTEKITLTKRPASIGPSSI